MVRKAIVAVAFVLVACGEQAQPVYERSIPDIDDHGALRAIRDDLPDADQDAWGDILMRKINPMAEPVRSKTVGEAIAKMKAKKACMAQHSQDISTDDIEAYNRQVRAYNACLKMPV